MSSRALGTALEWEEARKHADKVREWGIKQLLEIWNKAKGKERDAMLWGDEVEYIVVVYSEHEPKVLLSLRQADILKALESDKKLQKSGGVTENQQEHELNHTEPNTLPVFHPEFGRFMLETTPGAPWGIEFKELLKVEPDMILRRRIAKDHMHANEYPLTLTTYPRLGCPGQFTAPYYPVSGPKLRSQFVPDEIANPHIRFPTLAANIRTRRGRKVQVNVPVFRDKNTPWPWKDPTVNHDLHDWPEDDDVRNGAAPDNFIHMDAMAFGMGSCCLQITFQAKNITEGRQMYDQLSPLGPIMLALTAATPIYKGFLADTDVRWNQISNSVDDRTPEEMGENVSYASKRASQTRWRIPKSRYASNSTYISSDPRLRPEYMDPNLVIDPAIKQQLEMGGMDSLLATHFAHLFIRDPLVIFSEDLQSNVEGRTDHFENIQSTNWQHMRFKPPPADNSIGWRVEFRPMEIQITDFENAALSVFMVLVTRAILSFDLNFYIPIVKVDENMTTAHRVDAVLHEKFFFRKNIFPVHRPRRVVSAVAVNSVFDWNPITNNNSMNKQQQQQQPENSGASYSHAGSGAKTLGVGINTPHGSASRAKSHSPRPSRSSGRRGSLPFYVENGPVEDEYRLMSVDEIINGTRQARARILARSTAAAKQAAHFDGVDGEQSRSLLNSTGAQVKTATPAVGYGSSSGKGDTDDNAVDDEGQEFPGLVPLVELYLDSVNVDVQTRCRLAEYLDLVRKRASGELSTAARWIRDFVARHPEYKGDSAVTDAINKDLVAAVLCIGRNECDRDEKNLGRRFKGLNDDVVLGWNHFLGSLWNCNWSSSPERR